MEKCDVAHPVFVTLGATNHSDAIRELDDFYATDPIAISKLLSLEKFSPRVWECACGAGHLSKVLEEQGYEVKSTDLVYRGYGVGGVDFLAQWEPFDGDIITNPPYKIAVEFVRHALELVNDGGKVAMFLRLQFLEGKARRKLFEEYPPATVYVSSGRINCCRNGDFSNASKQQTGALAHAWIIWEKGYSGPTVLKWFN